MGFYFSCFQSAYVADIYIYKKEREGERFPFRSTQLSWPADRSKWLSSSRGWNGRRPRDEQLVIKHTYLVIIELASGAANYITEAEEESEEGERGGDEIYGRWKGRTKVSFRRDKKVATDKAACQCRAAILSGRYVLRIRISSASLLFSSLLLRHSSLTVSSRAQ